MTFPWAMSHPKIEGRLEVSRWISIQVLLDTSELRDLIAHLSSPQLLNVSRVVDEKNWQIDIEQLLTFYQSYIDSLIGKSVCQGKDLAHFFSGAMTKNLHTHYAMLAGEKGYLLKGLLPSIQMQHHHFIVSSDHRLLSMAHGREAISWGLQFSYPQIFRDPKKGSMHQTLKEETCVNNELFALLRKWIRDHTRPTSFLIHGQKKTFPIRIGRKVYSWIQEYEQLKQYSLEVVT